MLFNPVFMFSNALEGDNETDENEISIEWSENIKIAKARSPGQVMVLQGIVLDSENNAHICFTDSFNGKYEAYYTKLDNKGNKVIDKMKLQWNSSKWRIESIAVDSEDNLYIFWYGQMYLHLTKIDKKGNVLIENKKLPAKNSHPLLDQKDNIHVVWQENISNVVTSFYQKMDKNGTILVNATNLGFDIRLPRIVIDSDNYLHLVVDDVVIDSGLFYAKLNYDGNVMINITQIDWYLLCSIVDIVVGSDDKIYIVWGDGEDRLHDRNGSYHFNYNYMKMSKNGTVLVRDSFNNAATLSPDFLISLDDNCKFISFWRNCAVDSNNEVHVVWREKTSKGYEIYYKTTAPIKTSNNNNKILIVTMTTLIIIAWIITSIILKINLKSLIIKKRK